MNKDLAASVRARLLNVAKAQGADFNQVLVRFALERTGEIEGLNSLARDVTQARLAEGAQRDSEERYRLIFDMSVDAILLTQPEVNLILAANQAACTLYGYSKEELCALGREAILDVSDLRFSAVLAERQRIGYARGRVRGVKSNGESFPVEIATFVFHDSKGVQLAIVQLCDISEQKRAERALHESEMRWQFAVESHGDAMWDWDAKNDKLFLTAAARELFNLPETNTTRPIADLLERVIQENRGWVQDQIDNIISGKTSEWISESRMSFLGQAPRWVATRGRVMTRDASGRPERIVSISRDVTQRKLEEAKARRQTDLVAQQGRLVLLGELASALAHEINQPLTAITGFAAECARRMSNVPEALELVHAIEEQAMRAGEIAWRMRGFARRQRLGRCALSLHEVIAGVAKWMDMDRSSYPDVVIDITGVSVSLPPVDADRVELEQVLISA